MNGNINTQGIIGLDIELMNDMREQYSVTRSKNHQGNLDLIPFIWIGALPIITYYPLVQNEENTFRSAATVKIIQRYGILDSIVVMDKGSIVSTKNLVFDSETGDVVVSRTNNEFDDPVYQLNYPAYWAYSGMGPAYKNIDAVFTNKKVINGRMLNADESPFNVEDFFESGDEILIGVCNLTETVTNRSGDCPFYDFSGQTHNVRIWAMEAAKGKEGDKGLYFIDENGKPFHGFIESMRILRSGKRNMLSASVGGIVSLGNPVKEWSTGKYKIVADSSANIIQTSATTYKDLWQVEKSFYVKDSIVRVYGETNYLQVTPDRIATMKKSMRGTGETEEDFIESNSSFLATSYDYLPGRSCVHSRKMYSKSIMNFSLNEIPEDAIVVSAQLQFGPKIPKNFWTRRTAGGGLFCPKTYTYDWSTAPTQFYNGTPKSWLKRATTPLYNNTKYNDLQTSNDNPLAISEISGLSLGCTELIQDYVANPRYGLVLEIEKNTESNSNIKETNYLSLCAKSEAFAVYPCGHDPFPPCECSKPILSIAYKAYVDSIIKLCKENISDTATNPYRWGILGNWRADRAYTWYSDRRENDADVADTDIRKEGALKNFTSYWTFTSAGLINSADTTKWVWNAASSVYNKRGFEIENYDPLGRYNAGLYGYSQSLPVAVAQNSRYRELLYDGFEDYDFKNEACEPFCENAREFDFVKDQSGVTQTDTQSHTGRFSLKVNAGSESVMSSLVSSCTGGLPALSAQVDSTPVYTTHVIGAGTGFVSKYDQSAFQRSEVGCSGSDFTYSTPATSLDLSWGYATSIPNLCGQAMYSVELLGRIQAKTTDTYTFHLNVSGGTAYMLINNFTYVFTSGGEQTITIPLIAGQLYPVYINYIHSKHQGLGISLQWSANSLGVGKRPIPSSFLYPVTVTTPPPASLQTNIETYCVELNNVSAENIIRPKFSPIQSRSMVVSAWMKMDGEDCNTAPVLTDALKAGFKQGGTSLGEFYLEKTGVRIEGWQRYEKIVTVPATATEMYLSLKGTQGKTIYVDDIRMQPFNSSVKSFAYDAVSLRLMAELDENNYATFYEYDNDGTLIRVKKETERGIQTIKETRSALIKVQ